MNQPGGRPPRRGGWAPRRGFTLIEAVMFSVVIAALLSGGLVALRQAAAGGDMNLQNQAVELAQRLMETRRATGHFPSAKDLSGRARSLTVATSEARYQDTDLTKVAVTVSWRGFRARRRTVTLVSLL